MSAHKEEKEKKPPNHPDCFLLMYLKSSIAWLHTRVGSIRLLFVAKYESWKESGKQCVSLVVGCELHR